MALHAFLRKRSTWLLVYPLVVWAAVSVMHPGLDNGWLILPLFSYLFPAAILVGAGLNINHGPMAPVVGFMVAFFIFYLWFVVKVKTLSDKIVKWIALA